MARKVNISTIGARYHSLDPSLTLPQAVDEMISHLKGKVNQVLPDQPDLIVLPEYSDMPANFSTEKRFAFYKERGDRILDCFSELASENHCYIIYPSVQELEDGTWRNSIRLIGRDGQIAATYYKNHPTIGELEEGILSGEDAVVVNCDFGRVGFAICFDLNFDSLREKYVKAKPDLIVFSSMFHGGLMQSNWAYSCRSYFVGAIGGLTSSIISPVGEIIRSTTNYYDYITETVNLDYAVVHLDNHWKLLRAMSEKYGPLVKMVDPGLVGAVLITSESNSVTMQDIVNEFGFELLDDYFSRALARREADLQARSESIEAF
ncbi:carbon-nitrogen hydrolase family protein [Paenibacillus solisilvae]|uniref:Carbon-nitrogen hydrolase family protein n=1 Tax=Paenibacillus solisilvae TaxID=2486751 RepID=A0ABW0VNZ0_9BACL